MANILSNHLSGRKVTNSAPPPPPRRAELKKVGGGGADKMAAARHDRRAQPFKGSTDPL